MVSSIVLFVIKAKKEIRVVVWGAFVGVWTLAIVNISMTSKYAKLKLLCSF
jgi:hypothetical protein